MDALTTSPISSSPSESSNRLSPLTAEETPESLVNARNLSATVDFRLRPDGLAGGVGSSSSCIAGPAMGVRSPSSAGVMRALGLRLCSSISSVSSGMASGDIAGLERVEVDERGGDSVTA